jgi:hypothetical protein
MTASTSLDALALLRQAEASEHKEAYHILEKTQNYRIGEGVRLTPPNPPSFFVEILLFLASNNDIVYLRVLEKDVCALRELQARGFKAIFQDGNCISCEVQVPAERLQTEKEQDKTLMERIFKNKQQKTTQNRKLRSHPSLPPLDNNL